ncbi:MAG: radical SAM protein [Actinomycetota bacterium]|nr:radical SAM protein [Actinomycetota bacterium]
MNWNEGYPRLAEGIYLKVLEKPCAYNKLTDDLYELSMEALDFLRRCDGTRRAVELAPEDDFLSFCLEEGVLEIPPEPRGWEVSVQRNEEPSLRYLMMEVTERCNLRCRHCYLGDWGSGDMAWEKALRAVEDFDDMGGLRLLVTGGEPLLYPHFRELNRGLEDRSYRAVLITNGTLMDDLDLESLNFQEIQLSIDGMEEGHDYLRGRGTFRRVMMAAEAVMEAGMDLSVATVMYSKNLDQMEEMAEMLRGMGVSSWALEYPVPAGRMEENSELMPRLEDVLPFFELEWGLGPHEGAEGYACGAHLANLEPGGSLVKCGYYREISGGDIDKGLRQAWTDLPRMRPEGTCAACDMLEECGGGCRYRAELMTGKGGPDPLMCARFDVPLNPPPD